jgi:uncharacterized repeat protein (TIGR03803 family)
MNNPTRLRRGILGLHARMAGGALALAIVLALAVVATGSAQAQSEIVLWSFQGPPDGANPMAGLVVDAQGNLYGTTEYGGGGVGTVFKVSSSNLGQETVLYSFGGSGAFPVAGLVMDTQGNLYGTTFRWRRFRRRNGVQAGYDRPGDRAAQLHWALRRRKSMGRFSAGRAGQPVWHNPQWRILLLGAVRLRNGVQGGYDRPGDRALQLHWELSGRRKSLRRFSAGRAGNVYGTTRNGGAPPYFVGMVFEIQGAGFTTATATKTATTLSSSPNPSTYGQTVTFIAAVTSKLGAPPDGETVTFMRCTTVLGTGILSAGSASFTTSALPMADNSIKVVYSGDSNFAGSASKWSKQVVSKATTTTTLVSSQNPSSSGQSVTFTASVSPQFSGTPTGTLVFYDGTTKLGSKEVKGGVAELTTKKLTSGQHTIIATYSGSTDFAGGSASLVQTVN